MKIKITETQLKKLKSLLIEITVDDAYIKFYKDIPKEEYDLIVNADPFSKPKFLSPYAKWLLKIYKNKQLKLEDLERATEYIQTFDKFKQSEFKNIDYDKFKTLGELGNIVKNKLDYSSYESGKQVDLCSVIDGAKKVYEDEKWCVIIPETEYASCYYGRGTEWCTTWGEKSFDDRHKSKTNRFDYYDKTGPLFININKSDYEDRYQFHFETSQFMDIDDNEIELFEFIDNKQNAGLRNFYNNFLKDRVKSLKFSDLEVANDSCYIVVNDWGDFEDAFEEDRNYINPAMFLRDLDDNYTDYDYSRSDIKLYYLDDINDKNMSLIKEKLKENGYDLNEMDDDELEEAILDEFIGEIDGALSDAKRQADEKEAYDQITKHIINHFGGTNVEYGDKIKLKITCPEPILLYGMDTSSFITGYSEKYGKIDFNYPRYGFDGNIDNDNFNEILNDRLNW